MSAGFVESENEGSIRGSHEVMILSQRDSEHIDAEALKSYVSERVSGRFESGFCTASNNDTQDRLFLGSDEHASETCGC